MLHIFPSGVGFLVVDVSFLARALRLGQRDGCSAKQGGVQDVRGSHRWICLEEDVSFRTHWNTCLNVLSCFYLHLNDVGTPPSTMKVENKREL